MRHVDSCNYCSHLYVKFMVLFSVDLFSFNMYICNNDLIYLSKQEVRKICVA